MTPPDVPPPSLPTPGLPSRSPLRASARLTGFIVLNVVIMMLYASCVGPLRRWRRPIQVVWSRACYRLAGITVSVFGQRHQGSAALTVANHVSYLDIPILASLIDAAFVAKSEVGTWPLFGTAAKLTGTIFVNRKGADAARQRQELTARLAGGRGLLLFAEGTTTDGSRVAPFKSSLFSIVETTPSGGELVVQPVSIAYPRYADGTALTGVRRAFYCWFGETALMPHMIRMMGLKGARAEVRFHPPIRIDGPARRKDLAKRAETAVGEGVAEAFAATLALEPTEAA